MAFYGILGLGIYLLMKRNPAQCKNMLLHANNVVKYMPIDKIFYEYDKSYTRFLPLQIHILKMEVPHIIKIEQEHL